MNGMKGRWMKEGRKERKTSRKKLREVEHEQYNVVELKTMQCEMGEIKERFLVEQKKCRKKRGKIHFEN